MFELALNIAPGSRADRIRTLHASLEQSEWLAPADVQREQWNRLRDVLRHCAAHVPYYRDAWAAADVTPDEIRTLDDLRKLPIVDRAEYVRNATRLTASVFPAGTTREGILSTSGTTGIPVAIQNTSVVAEQWLAFSLRDMEWCGIDPRKRLASIRPSGKHGDELAALIRGVELPTWGRRLSEVVQTGVSHFMDMAADVQQQLVWLAQVDPEYLLSFPSNVDHLARLARDQRVRLPKLQAVQTIGEMLDDDMRAVIETVFAVPVFDTYSCCEAGYVASECPNGHGYHVHAENVIVEVLNDDNEPCRPGETGRVILTTLHNFATPFIRYDIHDEATVGPELCPCGRGLPLLTAIHGRRRPMFQLPNGSVKSSSQAAKIARGVGGFVQFQIVQTSADRILVRLVPDGTWKPHTEAVMHAKLAGYFGTGVTIDVECIDRMPVPAHGKLQSTVVEFASLSVTAEAGTQGRHTADVSGQPDVPVDGMPATTCEVVYACSTPDTVSETLRSCRSFAALMPRIRRILFVTPNVEAELRRTGEFDTVHVVDHPRHQHRPRFESMLACSAERALFIDGDTLLIEPMDDLFELLDHFDIALAAAPQYFHSQARALNIYDRLPRVADALPEWNSGVIAARVTDRFRAFVRRWSDLFADCQRLGYAMDQAALRSALATSNLRVATIPANYNFRAHMPQMIKGRVKLLHAHGDLAQIAESINISPTLRLYRPSTPTR